MGWNSLNLDISLTGSNSLSKNIELMRVDGMARYGLEQIESSLSQHCGTEDEVFSLVSS